MSGRCHWHCGGANPTPWSRRITSSRYLVQRRFATVRNLKTVPRNKASSATLRFVLANNSPARFWTPGSDNDLHICPVCSRLSRPGLSFHGPGTSACLSRSSCALDFNSGQTFPRPPKNPGPAVSLPPCPPSWQTTTRVRELTIVCPNLFFAVPEVEEVRRGGVVGSLLACLVRRASMEGPPCPVRGPTQCGVHDLNEQSRRSWGEVRKRLVDSLA